MSGFPVLCPYSLKAREDRRDSKMPWNPEQYNKFQSQRFAPFEDLMALIDCRPNLSAIDLGCGTGELTRRLADAPPNSNVLGVHNSPEMLKRAEAPARPRLRFEQAAVETTNVQLGLSSFDGAIS